MDLVPVIRKLLVSAQSEEKVAGVMLFNAFVDEQEQLGGNDELSVDHESFDLIQLLVAEVVESLSPSFILRMLQTKGADGELELKVHCAAIELLERMMNPFVTMVSTTHNGRSNFSISHPTYIDNLLTIAFDPKTPEASFSKLLVVLRSIALSSKRDIATYVSYSMLVRSVEQRSKDPITVLEAFTELVCFYNTPDIFTDSEAFVLLQMRAASAASSSSMPSSDSQAGVGVRERGGTTPGTTANERKDGPPADDFDEMEVERMHQSQSHYLRSIIVQCLHGGADESIRDRALIACLALLRHSVDEMRPYLQQIDLNGESVQESILSVWWSVERPDIEGRHDDNRREEEQVEVTKSEGSGQFALLLSSVMHGELHLLLEEAFGLFGNLEDGNLEAEDEGREGTMRARDVQKRRSLRAIRMIWVVLLLIDKVLLMLIGVSHSTGDDEELESKENLNEVIHDSSGVWSDLMGEFHDKIHKNLNMIVSEMLAFAKEVSLLKKSLGVVPQMLGNIVCRVTRSLMSLANEDQSYFSALLSHLDLILDSSRIPIENISQIVSSPNMDEATVSETAAILCGKSVFKKYLIVPGSHSVYRDTSYAALTDTHASAAPSATNSSASSPVRRIFFKGGDADRARNDEKVDHGNGTKAKSTLTDHFNLPYRRLYDSLDPDVNWNIGQGDTLQHVMPALLTLSSTFLIDIEGANYASSEPHDTVADEKGLRFGNLLLTQLCASQGFCTRLLSCVLVSCAYIITQPLSDDDCHNETSTAGAGAGTGTGAGDKGGDRETGGEGNPNNNNSNNNDSKGHINSSSSSKGFNREGGVDMSYRHSKDVQEFSRLCGTARVAAEQLNVLLEFSMGSEQGPQDEKLLEAVKPDIPREGGKDRSSHFGSNLKSRLDPHSARTVCSLTPVVWTTLFRNLRLITASLRSQVKPVAFNDDKAGSVSSLLFSLDELDSTVACLQPLLAL